MTLNENLQQYAYFTYGNNSMNRQYEREDNAKELEKIADDYAIGFLEWYFSDDGNNLIHDLILVGELDKNTNTQELLKIFKKEKGL
jgi:hypothetical protein